MITSWLSLTNMQVTIQNEIENNLQLQHQLSLNEFYVLLFLAESPEKKLKLQELQNMVGLSQSAMSRLVSRFEAKGCGALQRHICMEDRRAFYTSITKYGEEKLEKAYVTVNETLETIFSKKEIQNELQYLVQHMKR